MEPKLVAVTFICLGMTSAVQADLAVDESANKHLSGVVVEFRGGMMVQRAPAFEVRLEAEGGQPQYRVGEEVRLRVTSEADGYLYLLYTPENGKTVTLFPNSCQLGNRIVARKPLLLPDSDSGFRLRVRAPCGKSGKLRAIVVQFPILDPMNTETTFAWTRGSEYGEAELKLAFLPPDKRPLAGPRRIGLFVGIDRCESLRVPPLTCACADAMAMADVLRGTGGVDDATVLTNERATLSNIC